MRLKLIACEVLFRELCDACAHSSHQVNPEFLPKGLHDLGGKPMAAKIQDAVDRTAEGACDAILLGYGLCGNGLDGVTARHTRLVAPRAHDCIALLLGSRQRYQAYFDANPGTYYRSTGWLERAKDVQQLSHRTVGMDEEIGLRAGDSVASSGRSLTLAVPNGAASVTERGGAVEEHLAVAALAALIRQYGEDNGRYLYGELTRYQSQYSKLAFIETGLEPGPRFLAEAAAEAADKGWSFERLPGDMAWLRRMVNGEWDESEFVIAQPGQRIVASFDGAVLRVEG